MGPGPVRNRDCSRIYIRTKNAAGNERKQKRSSDEGDLVTHGIVDAWLRTGCADLWSMCSRHVIPYLDLDRATRSNQVDTDGVKR